MIRRSSVVFFALCLVLSLKSCATAPKTLDSNFIHVTVLHTNDVHGYAWPLKRKDGITRGGFAAQAYRINEIRKELDKKGGITLVLSGGDVNTGFPESDLLSGEPDLISMNMIGYDAMAIGNHEFDGGLQKLLRQKRLAKFPMLSANVVYSDQTASVFAQPFTLLDKHGMKFGILGLTTDSLEDLSTPENLRHLKVKDVIKTATEETARLKEWKPDMLIAVTHIGLSQTGKRQGVAIVNDDRKLAEANLGYSLIVGGHSHTLLTEGEKVNNTLIVQAGEKGEYLGRADLLWDKTAHKVVESQATVIPLNVAHGEDKPLKEVLDKYQREASKSLEILVGETQVYLDAERENIRFRETNFGNLVCDSLREKAQSDVAVFNAGGIRSSIPQGPIKFRDLLMALPFRNTLVTAKVSGKELKDLLQLGLDRQGFTGSLLQVSGIKYQIRDGKVASVLWKSKELEDKTQLLLATNSFVMSSKDFAPTNRTLKKVKQSQILVDTALAEYLKKHSPINPSLEGRLKVSP